MKHPLQFIIPIILLVGIFTASCQKQTDFSPQINTLQSQVSALQKRCDSLSNAVSNSNETILSLTSEILTLTTNQNTQGLSIDSVKTQIAGILTSLTTLNTQVQQQNTQIANLSSQLTQANANISAINTQITQIDAQLQQLNTEYSALLSQLNSILAQLNGPSSLSNNGLVAYYPFSGNANDASGNAHNGIVYGATLTTDRFGNPNSAYSFNGSSSYIQIPASESFNLPDSLTFSAWVNTTNTQIGQRILSKLIEGTPTGWVFDFSTGTGNINKIRVEVGNIAAGGGTGIYSSPSFTQNNTWTLITVTYDLQNVRIYLNGQLDTTYPLTTNTLPYLSNVIIGASTDSKSGFFNGKLDEIRVYNRALTQSEITYLATH